MKEIPQPPLNVTVEKIYKIDDVGNVDVERNWIITNRTSKEVDISEFCFFVDEKVESLVNPKAKDESGDLYFDKSENGSQIRLELKPRMNKLSSFQKYKLSLFYHFPNNVHMLGDVWLFTEIISGVDMSEFSDIVSNTTDFRIQVILPKLKKRFWEKIFHESKPFCKELSNEEIKLTSNEDKMLQWTRSLKPNEFCRFELIYGVKTNTKLSNLLYAIGTAVIVGVISYGFDKLKGG